MINKSSKVLRANPEFDPFEVERREVRSDNFNPENSHVLSPWRRSRQPILSQHKNKARQELSL
jgi:hypothetical protein